MKKYLKIVAVVLIGVLFLAGCKKGAKDSIVGSWKYESADYTYTFKEDGTGTYNALGTIMEFTYTIDETGEEKKISILYKGNTAPFETTFTIKDKELNIKDSFGKDTIYKKQ